MERYRQRIEALVGVFVLLCAFCAALNDNELPSGRSADIMKRMFGEVRPYSFQHPQPESKVEDAVLNETAKLSDAVQQVQDNDIAHDGSRDNSNSLVPPAPTGPATTAAAVSPSVSKASTQPVKKPASKVPVPKMSSTAADRIFDAVFSAKNAPGKPSLKSKGNLRGAPAQKAEEHAKEEKHEADLKRSYDALDKSTPETKEALVETSEKTSAAVKSGVGAKLDAKEKALKMTENNPFYEKYSSTEKVKKNPAPRNEDDQEQDDQPSLIEEQQGQEAGGTPMTTSDKDVTLNTAETMAAAAAMNQPVAHPVNSAWNPLNQDHTPQALTYGAVTDPNAPHLPGSQYALGSMDQAGSVVPSPTYLAGSHGVVNSQYLRSPGVSTMPQQMSASLPGYNSGYQAGLAAAQGSAQQTALIEQRQHPVNKFKEGYEAGLAAAKYKAGYEAGLHALEDKSSKVAPKPAVKQPAVQAQQQQQRFVQVAPGSQTNVPQVQQQSQPQQLVIKVVQEKSSRSSGEAYSAPKISPKQRLLSKASLVSNNGMPQRLSASRPQASTRGLTRNNLALLDLKSKATSKANNRMRDGTAQSAKKNPTFYNGNYLASWPPPHGTQQHLMTPLLGNAVAPAVPPPSPPQIGMAPAPPPASTISNTPDVLPQPTPPTEASDVRYGAKRFPDQSDAGSWPGGAGTDAKQSGEQGEPLLNEPLMTPFGKEDTQNAMGVMK
eukprot:g10880.t1